MTRDCRTELNGTVSRSQNATSLSARYSSKLEGSVVFTLFSYTINCFLFISRFYRPYQLWLGPNKRFTLSCPSQWILIHMKRGLSNDGGWKWLFLMVLLRRQQQLASPSLNLSYLSSLLHSTETVLPTLHPLAPLNPVRLAKELQVISRNTDPFYPNRLL